METKEEVIEAIKEAKKQLVGANGVYTSLLMNDIRSLYRILGKLIFEAQENNKE